MTEQEIKDLKTRADDAEAEAKKYKTDAEAKDVELGKVKEAEGRRVQDGLKAEFKGYCDQLVTDKKLTPAARDILTKEGACQYTDDKVTLTLEAFKAYGETLKPIIGEEDGGSEGDKKYKDKGTALDAKCKEYMAEKGCSYTDAMEHMPTLHPELYKAYTESTGVYAGKDGE